MWDVREMEDVSRKLGLKDREFPNEIPPIARTGVKINT